MAKNHTNRTGTATKTVGRRKKKEAAIQARTPSAPHRSAPSRNEKASALAAVGTTIDSKKGNVKGKKAKVVRDSFTMPASEYARIAELKQACLALGVSVKKSELLRAGIALLNQLAVADLKRTVLAVENIKTGRPAGKSKHSKEVKN